MSREHLNPPIFGHAQCENSISRITKLINHIRHELHSRGVYIDEGLIMLRGLL